MLQIFRDYFFFRFEMNEYSNIFIFFFFFFFWGGGGGGGDGVAVEVIFEDFISETE